MIYPEGTQVVITGGDFEGNHGVIELWEEVFELYVVHLEGSDGRAYHVGVRHAHLFPIDLEPPSQSDEVPPFGLTSEEFADYTEQFIRDSASRIRGVGNEQYSQGDHQQFESMDLDDIFEYAEEEIRDLANYASMAFIRIRRVRDALRDMGVV